MDEDEVIAAEDEFFEECLEDAFGEPEDDQEGLSMNTKWLRQIDSDK